jgi:AraC-like DNA-binding protein
MVAMGEPRAMTEQAADTLQVQAQGAGVRSLLDRGMTWVSFDPIPDLSCKIDFALRKLPGLGLLSGTVEGVRHVHAPRDSGDGNDDFSFHLNVSGISTVASRRGDLTLTDGDGMLLSYSAERIISRPFAVDHRVIRLPRKSLGPLVHNIDDAVLRPIPSGTGALNLLRKYVDGAFCDPALAGSRVRQLVRDQLCDLVAVTIGATRDAAAVAEGRGIRAGRLWAIKVDIEARLLSRDLSIGDIARRHRISEIYIRKLFASEETTFSQFVLHRRLIRAHSMLTDARWADRNVAWIAFEVGFGDLSYFNRTFKRLYGVTPSDLRSGSHGQMTT